MSDINLLKNQYLEYLEIEKGRAIRTVENYDHYVSVFLKQTKVTSPSDITDEAVREFRIWLNRQAAGNNRATGDTMKKKTQNYYLIALRSFLKYMAKRGIPSLSSDKIELAKVPERSLDLITSMELSRLMSAPDLDKDDLEKARGHAILELFFSTGLRVSELCSLNRDMDLRSDELSMRGKGGKVRVVFLSPEAKKAVQEYLTQRRDLDDALFVRLPTGRKDTKGNVALTRRSIERIVKQYAIKAGISKKVTPHIIRHCFATDLLSNGADLRSVQVLLGHSNITTTQVYTHVTDKHLREIHQRFHNKKDDNH